MPKPPMKPGTEKLSDVARHVMVPEGIVSTGWPAVRDTCAGFGVSFDPWQDGAGKLILAKRADGSYAASIGGVVLSIPRQVGKTFLLGAIVFALCLLHPGLTVLWTAHRLRTADETFAKMQSFARKSKVKPHVAKVVLGSGTEEIVFHNGSRILFGARERGFGRGFDDVDVEVFDEAQILTENAVDDMIPAMNTAANPLPIFIGTPPKPTDPSDVFIQKRRDALAGDEDTALIEFSADHDADPEDRKQWAKANPSYPRRTPASSMLRMKKNLSPESFLREGMGIWDEEDNAPQWKVITRKDWDDKADNAGPDAGWLTGPASLGIEKPFEGGLVSIGAAGACRSGGVGMQLVAQVPPEQVPALIVALTTDPEHPVSHVAIDSKGPAAGLVPGLVAAGVTLLEAKYDDLRQTTGDLFDDLTGPRGAVWHRNQPVVNTAVGHLATRSRGDAQLIERKGEADSAPFGCLNLARWAHLQPVAAAAEPDFLIV